MMMMITMKFRPVSPMSSSFEPCVIPKIVNFHFQENSTHILGLLMSEHNFWVFLQISHSLGLFSSSKPPTVCGFDIEWKVNYNPGESQRKTAVFQLCLTETECFVFHASAMLSKVFQFFNQCSYFLKGQNYGFPFHICFLGI